MALAGVLAAQRARERQIEDALTAAFDRLGDVRERQLALEAADRDLAAAVAMLAELGQGPQDIADHTELQLKEVHRLLKLAEESPAAGNAGTPPADRLDSTGAVPATLAG